MKSNFSKQQPIKMERKSEPAYPLLVKKKGGGYRMKSNFLMDAIIFLLVLVCFEHELTGKVIHEWLGLALASAVIVHLVMHWDWIVAILRRIFNRMSLAPRINSTIDILLAFAFLILILSGLITSKSIWDVLGIQVADYGINHEIWHEIHSVFSNFFLFLIGVHFALHWKWINHAWIRYARATLKSRSVADCPQ